MGIHYRTSAVEPRRRFDYWSDEVCRYGIPAASRLLRDVPFDGELRANQVGTVSINRMAAPLHHWRRDTVHVRRGQENDLWLCYLLEGQAFFRQCERDIRLTLGEILLYDEWPIPICRKSIRKRTGPFAPCGTALMGLTIRISALECLAFVGGCGQSGRFRGAR